MSGRAIRTTSRIAFFLCGLISLFTAVPFLVDPQLIRSAEPNFVEKKNFT